MLGCEKPKSCPRLAGEHRLIDREVQENIDGSLVGYRETTKREHTLIARHWRGWTQTQNADIYENLLKDRILPGLKSISGCRGGYLLRSDGTDEVEFVVISFFDSLAAVQRFAGPDYSVAVFEPEARKLLSRIEPTATHYEVRVDTTSSSPMDSSLMSL